MATSWQEMVDLGARAPHDAAPAAADGARAGAAASSGASARASRKAARRCSEEICASLFDRIDEETWERLEEALILADVGAPTTAAVVERLEHEVDSGAVSADGVAVRDRLIEILAEVAATGRAPIDLSAEPAVLMMVGVNGTGKTTTIGKIAWHLSKEIGPLGRARRRRHLPRRRRRAAGDVGRAGRRRAGPRRSRRRPRRRRLRRDQRRPRPRRRRRHRRHRRPPPHPGQPDGGAGEGAPGDRQADPRRPARDADLDRRHHRPERAAPGQGLLRSGRRSTASS